MRFYAGIGSRETPKPWLDLMETMASVLARKGYTLRSGAAEADIRLRVEELMRAYDPCLSCSVH